MKIARHQSLYQINTRVLLERLSKSINRRATLDDIPDEELDLWQEMGFDWIWMLGVWQTGNAGQIVSRMNVAWRHEFEETLPDLVEEDIAGSMFAITGYHVHSYLGGEAALVRFRKRLQKRGLKLMLDFVPNHMALDHPWVNEHPTFFIEGTEEQLSHEPLNYCRIETKAGARILAYGRDPYFSGWPDTLQLNYANPDLQQAMTEELLRISEQCDAVRCDMAMLLLPEVFKRTWGLTSEAFWPTAIERVRQANPGFQFLAEVYWDLEWTLQKQGFDFTYDKRLYDRLRDGATNGVRDHLRAEIDFQSQSARFLENHDEQRATITFPNEKNFAAAALTYLIPGLRFFHQGQLEGYTRRISPHLVRGPNEPTDLGIAGFYRILQAALKKESLRNGTWSLLDCQEAWSGNWTHQEFIAFVWQHPSEPPVLVAVNYSPHQSQCYVPMKFHDWSGKEWLIQELFNENQLTRPGDDLKIRGLYLDLGPWGTFAGEFKPMT